MVVATQSASARPSFVNGHRSAEGVAAVVEVASAAEGVRRRQLRLVAAEVAADRAVAAPAGHEVAADAAAADAVDASPRLLKFLPAVVSSHTGSDTFSEPFFFSSFERGLLKAQRVNWIERSGLSRRIIAEENTDHHGKDRRHSYRCHGRDHRPSEHTRHQR